MRVCIEFAEIGQEYVEREQIIINGWIGYYKFHELQVYSPGHTDFDFADSLCSTITENENLLDRTDDLQDGSWMEKWYDTFEFSFVRPLNINYN